MINANLKLKQRKYPKSWSLSTDLRVKMKGKKRAFAEPKEEKYKTVQVMSKKASNPEERHS